MNISENQPQLKNRVVDGLIDSPSDRQTGINGSEKQSSSQDQETRQSLVNISENQPQLKNRVVDGLIDSPSDRQTGIKRVRSKYDNICNSIQKQVDS